MEFSAGRRCSICGAAITDENPDGIGFGCRKVYEQASWTIFFEVKERAYAYSKFINDAIITIFKETFKTTKFRSEFRKTFYPSIIQQFKEKGYISAKQRQIMIDMLGEKNSDWCYRFHEMPFPSIQKAVTDRRDYFSNWLLKGINGEEMEHLTALANKLRHQ